MTPTPGSQSIPFQLKGTDDQSHTWDTVSRDKQATVLIFSCNHCPYVVAWEDRMIDLGKHYGPRGVGFALINANDAVKYPQDSFPEMVRRSRDKAYPFPYLHDEDQSTARAYGATRTPEAFLFDAQGVLRYHGRIDDNYEDPGAVRSHDLKDALEAVLKGDAPPVPQTPPVGCSVKWK